MADGTIYTFTGAMVTQVNNANQISLVNTGTLKQFTPQGVLNSTTVGYNAAHVSCLVAMVDLYQIERQSTYTAEATPILLNVAHQTYSGSQRNLSAESYTSTFPATGVTGASIPVTGTIRRGVPFLPVDVNVVYPGATFLLQDGIPAPIYPSFVGALVYDIALKKWGKLKESYRTLIDYSPVNNLNGALGYTNFGMDAAMLSPINVAPASVVLNGTIHTFDARPVNSWIRYGKMGLYRRGKTKIHEIHAHFRTSSNGSIILDSSIDGRSLELSMTKNFPFASAASATFNVDSIGSWHTVIISGQFDLQYLEVRGNMVSRR